MRHSIRQLTALGLALALLTTQAAWASDALGWDLHAGTTVLSEGTVLTRSYFWSDTYQDLRTERYVTYAPNEAVRPAVVYGEDILSRATLSQMAEGLEEAGERVVGGVNGDFYVVATGQPLGLVITEGVVRSSSSYHPAVGFRADGSAFVGTPNLTVSAVMLGERVTVFGGINKIRQVRTEEGGGLTLLTGDFGGSTQNTAPGVDVFLTPVADEAVGEVLSAEETGLDRELVLADQLRVGSRVRCVVDYVTEAAGANPIPAGRMVLTMNGRDDEGTLNMLRSLQPGDEVDIDLVTGDRRWEEAREAVGGMYTLLADGEVGQDLDDERTARTAIGVKSTGEVVFYTLDGRQPGNSIGATCGQVARRLLELGCVEALSLDGGGSTTLGASDPLRETFQVLNSPSDGRERANSTAVFLTTRLEHTGEAAYLQLEPGDALVLAGASIPLMAYRVDTGYRLMGAAARCDYQLTGAGEAADNLFTAGMEDAVTVVTATQGELTGQAVFTTIRTPDDIEVTNESTGGKVLNLTLDPGETVSLGAESFWRNLPLASRDENYIWSCDEAVGAVTEDGTFTAGDRTASGSLYVTAGELTVVIPVNVAGHILLLDDMEKEEGLFSSAENVELSFERELNHVRTGRQSLRADYDMGESGAAGIAADIAIPAGEKYLGLWVYGDGSGNTLLVSLADGTGETGEFELAVLNFTGWEHVLMPLPWDGATLTGLLAAPTGETSAGTVWLDQLTTANEEMEDFTPPQIDLEMEGAALTATVSDDVDKSVSQGAVLLQYDGAMLSGIWDDRTGTLTATLPEPGEGSHRVTVTAVDVSGNVGRISCDIPGETTAPFRDMEDHWALPYAGYLYEQGVTQGVSDGEELYFQPDSNITRAEFFTMVARWMGLDLAQYEDVELPFADLSDIPEWALGAVRAMYQRGVVQGSLDEGALYLRPNDGVRRCEVMTILGRTQMRGYPEVELDAFADGDEVSAWAESYVRSLVGQGVVNGYADMTLRPNAPMTRGEAAKVLWALR